MLTPDYPLRARLLPLTLALIAAFSFFSCKKENPKVLVFSKTEVFRHESIEAGKAALIAMGAKYHFDVDTTENDSAFFEDNLKKYAAVIFLNTTGNVLNAEQQNNFERYIQAGGGYVGIHAASDTEYDWPWYGKLVGAYFKDHPLNPNVQEGEYYVVDDKHVSTDSMPERFKRTDEFYNFRDISDNIHPLVKIDESTYKGGNNGDNHPTSWYQEYDGGRSFYTAMGHTNESFSEPLFLKHLWGGLSYVMNDGKPKKLDYTKVHTQLMPAENRFVKVVLAEKLNEPIELVNLPSGNVLFIERHGAIKVYDQNTKEVTVIDSIPISHLYTNKEGKVSEAEDGLLGVQLDPNYKTNHFIYLYYSQFGDQPVNVLARFTMDGEAKLIHDSKVIMLEVPVQREQCCHTGGSIAFDGQGNLFVSTGDNTSPRIWTYGPTDERPDRGPWDAQKSSSNTNDLRGKIIRIHPEADGTYTIPEGNLFPKGMEKTRPEIYAMGTRNPYRISVDKKTGYVYWGEVGPDANKDSTAFGSRGYDEVNQAKKAGFFGWPYFVGNNQAYVDYDYAAQKGKGLRDPNKPTNDSPNNTGLNDLPPAQSAFIWYPYAKSEDFPLVGSGARNAMAGPVYHAEDFKGAARAFPDYYDGKLLIYDWMRGWIMAITMDDKGDYQSMEPFMGSHKFSNPIDMEFAANGDLYILEYGTGWFQGNDNARLVRIEYNAGNRNPIVQTSADNLKGATPLTSHFSSQGTLDYDKDKLTYNWEVRTGGKTVKSFSTPDMDMTFDKPGIYQVELVVKDGKGGETSSILEVAAGNEPPTVEIAITEGNGGFFFPGGSFNYAVKVNDKEDGSLASGGISPDAVSVSIDYLPEGFDKAMIVQGHKYSDEISATSNGKNLVENSDCKACHALDKKSIGPSYTDISKKYAGDAKAAALLAQKVKQGGSGVWGEVAMAAHPGLADKDIAEMVGYILSVSQKSAASLPVTGKYPTVIPKGQSDQGVFLIRASYQDKGANGLPGVRTEKVLMLRNASLSAAAFDESSEARKIKIPGQDREIVIASKDGAYLVFKNLDLTGIGTLGIAGTANKAYGMAGGKVEVRLGSPTGALIGETNAIISKAPAPSASNPMGGVDMVFTPIKPTAGQQDVYLVCKSSSRDESAMLFVLMQVIFQSGK